MAFIMVAIPCPSAGGHEEDERDADVEVIGR